MKETTEYQRWVQYFLANGALLPLAKKLAEVKMKEEESEQNERKSNR